MRRLSYVMTTDITFGQSREELGNFRKLAFSLDSCACVAHVQKHLF
jgi:hypothetical protein